MPGCASSTFLLLYSSHTQTPPYPLHSSGEWSDGRYTKVTYVAKASRLAKRFSKPMTMTGINPEPQGYSKSITEWKERKQTCFYISLPTFLFYPTSSLYKTCCNEHWETDCIAIFLSSIENKQRIYSIHIFM